MRVAHSNKYLEYSDQYIPLSRLGSSIIHNTNMRMLSEISLRRMTTSESAIK